MARIQQKRSTGRLAKGNRHLNRFLSQFLKILEQASERSFGPSFSNIWRSPRETSFLNNCDGMGRIGITGPEPTFQVFRNPELAQLTLGDINGHWSVDIDAQAGAGPQINVKAT